MFAKPDGCDGCVAPGARGLNSRKALRRYWWFTEVRGRLAPGPLCHTSGSGSAIFSKASSDGRKRVTSHLNSNIVCVTQCAHTHPSSLCSELCSFWMSAIFNIISLQRLLEPSSQIRAGIVPPANSHFGLTALVNDESMVVSLQQ